MKIIEKIEIKHFRSFDGSLGEDKVEIIDLKDINIFSGANDSGKSNILRALNLFFNHEISPGVPFDIERDLSKIQKARSDAKAKDKRESGKKDVRQKDLWVKVKLYFKKDKGGVLPERFFVEKTWDKNGLHSNRKHNIKENPDPKKSGAQEGQLTQFLNNIKFEYVPAVKDRQFFNELFKKLQYGKRDNKTNCLEIELLFTDDILKKIDCYDSNDIGYGITVTKIQGQKKTLWKKLFDLNKDDFTNFKPLFEKINELFQL